MFNLLRDTEDSQNCDNDDDNGNDNNDNDDGDNDNGDDGNCAAHEDEDNETMKMTRVIINMTTKRQR